MPKWIVSEFVLDAHTKQNKSFKGSDLSLTLVLPQGEGVVTTPFENFFLPPQNQKGSDQSYLGNLKSFAVILTGKNGGGGTPSGGVG